ncbi:MAG: DUF6732 family protein [Pseudomonadota bacterium]
MKSTLTLTAALLLSPALALAHAGHVAPEDGHSHLAEFALLSLGALAVAAILRRVLRRQGGGSSR